MGTPTPKAMKKCHCSDLVTSVHVILDRSGSMTSVREQVIGSFNEYLQSLKADRDNSYELSMTFFDSVVQTGRAIPLAAVEPLTAKSYAPDGATALYDAVYMTLTAARSEKGNRKHLVLIFTDGYENASREYSEHDLKKLMKQLDEEGNFTVVYLGANQDAWAEAAKWGVKSGNASVYRNTNAGMGNAMSVLASNTRAFASSSVPSSAYFFSSKDVDSLKHTA